MRIAKKTPNKTISLILYFACFSLIIGLFFFSWTPALSMAPESELSISGGSINEIDGSIAFTITRTNTPDVVTVTVQSADGTAEAGTDYVAFPATDIIFAGGGGVQTEIITVTVNDDINIELDETFNMVLSDPINASIIVTEAVGTINNNDTATVKFDFDGDVAGVEGSGSNRVLAFTATVDNQVPDGFDMSYTIVPTSATVVDDYLAPSGVLTFDGSFPQTQTISVTIVADNLVEPFEEFLVTLGSASNSIYASSVLTQSINSSKRGRIIDDDAALATIEVGSAAEDAGTLPYTVTLDNPVSEDVVVTVNTTNGSAEGGSDFTALTNFDITIPAGMLTATRNITLIDDSSVEPDETFSVELDAIDGQGLDVTIGSPSSQTGTILADDDKATVSISPVNQPEGNVGTSVMVFTATLDNAVKGGFDIPYNSANGSATAGVDFVTNVGTLSFVGNAGETQTINLTINGDSVIEPNETLSMNLGTATGSALAGQVMSTGSPATSTIINDDTIEITPSGATVSEADGQVPYTLTLTTIETEPVTVTIRTNDGTAAVADNDYVPQNDLQVVIPAGAKSYTGVITINNDNKVEADEKLSLSVVSFVSGGDEVSDTVPPAVELTIENDDSATVQLLEPIAVLEGNTGVKTVTITATLDSPVEGGFTVAYLVNEETADLGTDFNGANGSLTFTGTAGETQTFTAEIIGDEVVEPNEAFSFQLDSLSNTNFTDSISVVTQPVEVTIIDDDTAGVIVNSASITEGDSGPQALTFEVSLTKDVSNGFTVDYNTADDSATAISADYAPISGTLTFTGTEGEVQTFTVDVLGDLAVETTESFFVNLSNISDSAVMILQGQGSATITDDDSATLQIESSVIVTETDSGQTDVAVTVTLDNPVQGGLELPWNVTENGATVADNDFAAATSPITFAGTAGETQSVIIQVYGDTKVELDEAVDILLGTPTLPTGIADSAVQVTEAESTLTIQNDDVAMILLQGESKAEGTNAEGTTFLVKATLTADTDAPVSVDYATRAGSGLEGIDFNGKTGTVNFTGSAGETQTIEILVPADDIAEGNKTFLVEVTSISAEGRNVVRSEIDPVATVTIIDDDDPVKRVYLPVVSINYKRIDGPDLIVSDVQVGTESITVTIKNVGNEPVTRPFWIDSYINPTTPPTGVNQTIIGLGAEGFVWGIQASSNPDESDLPMAPNDEIVLTVGGSNYYPDDSKFTTGTIPAAAQIYVQVDSFGSSSIFGQIFETHEQAGTQYNNIFMVTAP